MSTLYALDFHHQRDYFLEKYLIWSYNKEKKLTAIELTCPAGTNLISSRECKSEHYKELKNLSLVPCNGLELFLLEILALGFVTKHVRDFNFLLSLFKSDTKKVMMCCSEVARRCSYYIYCRRNKEWLTPEILKFV